jgi:hypothetical protein
MASGTVVAIDEHVSWRGTKGENKGKASARPAEVLDRIARFCSDCRTIGKYLLLDGSLNIECQKDGLLISRKNGAPNYPKRYHAGPRTITMGDDRFVS